MTSAERGAQHSLALQKHSACIPPSAARSRQFGNIALTLLQSKNSFYKL